MALNPFSTFQRNRRFWMAAILMICMVTFVFCTGRGDMGDRIQGWLGRGGASAFTIDGKSYDSVKLHNLREQRNLADKLMKNTAEMAFQEVSKRLHDMGNTPQDKIKAEDIEQRQRTLTQFSLIQMQLSLRKSRPRYFDGGVKFDDLVEFATWLAMADRLGIYLDDNHLDILFHTEFLVTQQFPYLSAREFDLAEMKTRQDFRDVGHAGIRNAIKDEFRVRIAQEACLKVQLTGMFGQRSQVPGLTPKLLSPDFPDLIRTPITSSIMWDEYKKQRAEFDVTFIPIEVQAYVAKMKTEPTEDEKAMFYKAAKDRTDDPTSDQRGLQLPPRAKFKYLYADPVSPGYLESAKLIERLNVFSPVASDAAFSPFAVATRYWILDGAHRANLERIYGGIRNPTDKFNYATAPPGAEDYTTPLLMWLARRHWEAGAGLSAGTLPTIPDAIGSIATFMAWGKVKHPDILESSLNAEAKRRAPLYASMVGSAIADPWGIVGTHFALNYNHVMVGAEVSIVPRHQELPVEAAYHELEEMRARQSASAKAQKNMQIVRAALDKADGDSEKFKRELNRLIPEMKLTYGPSEATDLPYHSRYTVLDAKELKPLKDAYEYYNNAINMFEARDLTPDRMLKPEDFQKMLFDSAESFAATAPYRAMPWPPVVTKPSNQRMFGIENTRLIKQVDPALEALFRGHVAQHDPTLPLPAYDGLFKNAEKPILFWRTTKRDLLTLPAEYSQIEVMIKKKQDEWNVVEKNIKKQEQLIPVIDELRRKRADLIKSNNPDAKQLAQLNEELRKRQTELNKLIKEASGTVDSLRVKQADYKDDEADYKDVQRAVVEGWKFDQARSKDALDASKNAAESLIKENRGNALKVARELTATPFPVKSVCRMFPEVTNGIRDYIKPPLPKDKINHARDDMMEQVLSLYDLGEPVKIGNKDLDDLNKELFDQTKKMQNPKEKFVQILTNKPRSVFYVAFIELPPNPSIADFITTMKLASMPEGDMGGPEAMVRRQKNNGLAFDRFVDRIQQQEGRRWREVYVNGLRTMLNYSEDDPKARERFDEKVVSD